MRLTSLALSFSAFDLVLQPAGPPAPRRPQNAASAGGRPAAADVANINAELRRFVSLKQGK